MRLKGVVLGLAACVFCSTIPSIPVSAQPPYLKIYEELAETNAEFVDYDPLTDTIVYTSEAGAAHSDKVFQTVGFEMSRVVQPQSEVRDGSTLSYFDDQTYAVLSIDDSPINIVPNSELLSSHHEECTSGGRVISTWEWKVEHLQKTLKNSILGEGGEDPHGSYAKLIDWGKEFQAAYQAYMDKDETFSSKYPYGYWINLDSMMIWKHKSTGVREPKDTVLSDVNTNMSHMPGMDGKELIKYAGLCDFTGYIYTHNTRENHATLWSTVEKVLDVNRKGGADQATLDLIKQAWSKDYPTALKTPSEFYKDGPIARSVCPYDEHWERPLCIIPPVEPLIIEEPPVEIENRDYDDEFVTYIGSRLGDDFGSKGKFDFRPYFKTYNYSPVFSLSSEVDPAINPFEEGFEQYYKGGIPSSENITNGIEVDQWYGRVGIGRHTETKTYHFTLKWYTESTHRGSDGKTHRTRHNHSKDYPKTVSVTYYYIWDCGLYDFDSALVLNDCFTGDKVSYTSNTMTNFNLIKDGKDLSKQIMGSSQSDWKSNGKEHVKWANLKLTHDGGKNGKDKAKRAADKEISGIIAQVNNDRIEINGKVYLDNKVVSLKNNKITDSYKIIEPLDVPLEERTQITKIPDRVANGIYPTTFTPKFKMAVPGNNHFESFTLSGDEAIKKLKPGNGVVAVTVGDIPG